tara:strand:+ start:32514 stop:32627 length:114 start_codon:yes stop_codon:yes gene_type:complete
MGWVSENFGLPLADEIEEQEGNTQSGVTDIDLTVKSL